MALKIETNLKFIGEYVAYQVCGYVKEISQLANKYNPQKIIFTGNCKEQSIESYEPDAFLTVYILLNQEQAMLFRLSNNLDK
mgnify:FL=1|tara:strand:- start:1934 stop:2179 length:246 start_codon:yes stop_codon:yes gene_type:complete